MQHFGDLSEIRWIVFDFGEVLFQVHFEKAEEAFARLARSYGKEPQDVLHYSRARQSDIFDQLEKGLVTPGAFRDTVRRDLGIAASDSEIDTAWNALLGSPYPERADMLRRLSRRYRLALLSNTNAIHYAAFYPESKHLFDELEQAFLSFEMGMRKPDREIYAALLQRLDAGAGEVLFIDDSLENVRAAEALGIRCVWLEFPEALEAVCRELLPDSEGAGQ